MAVRKAAQILRDAALMQEAKDREYGSGYLHHGAAMAALFPDGVELKNEADFARFALFDLMMVKMVRYARSFANGHNDSLTDLAVYAALLQEVDNGHIVERRLARVGAADRAVGGRSGPPSPRLARAGDTEWGEGDPLAYEGVARRP